MKKLSCILILCMLLFAQIHAQTTTRIDLKNMTGKSFSEVFDLLIAQGFTSITPVPVQSNLPEETVLGLKILGKDVEENAQYPVNTPVRVLVSMGSMELFQGEQAGDQPETPVTTGNLLNITANPIIMTGLRFQPIEIATEPIFMTGCRFQPIEIVTEPIIMTGRRFEPIEITTGLIMMTGLRFKLIEILTDSIIMTGLRDVKKTEPLQPVEHKTTIDNLPVVRPKIQESLEKEIISETPKTMDSPELLEEKPRIDEKNEPVDSTKMEFLNKLKSTIQPEGG